MMLCILCSLPWKYNRRYANGSVSQYLISLCRPLNLSTVDCGANSSVCLISGSHGQSVGNAVEDFSDSILTENPETKELILQLNGSQCGVDTHMTFVIFKCGKTLVSFYLK